MCISAHKFIVCIDMSNILLCLLIIRSSIVYSAVLYYMQDICLVIPLREYLITHFIRVKWIQTLHKICHFMIYSLMALDISNENYRYDVFQGVNAMSISLSRHFTIVPKAPIIIIFLLSNM